VKILLDLCSGVGGFHLGAIWAGLHFDKVYFSEIEEYPIDVYKKRFPDAIPLGDIKELDCGKLCKEWGADRKVIITGGLPCQPHSVAGKHQGETDQRNLWPWYWRIIRDIRPDFAILENVPGIFTSNGGRFFHGIINDLSKIGYLYEWAPISAENMGAFHKRERMWFVAYPNSTWKL
jgi:DNA (cytosine-5)-methyltransferase 1